MSVLKVTCQVKSSKSSRTLEADDQTNVLTILYPMKNPYFEATLSTLRENLRV